MAGVGHVGVDLWWGEGGVSAVALLGYFCGIGLTKKREKGRVSRDEHGKREEHTRPCAR